MTEKKPLSIKWFFLILGIGAADIALKWWATVQKPSVDGLVGFHYFENPGITGGVTIPLELVLVITILALGLIGWLFYINLQKRLVASYGLFALLIGALGNFVDRAIHFHTTDYLLLGNAVINLSDILIVAGLILLFRYSKVRSN